MNDIFYDILPNGVQIVHKKTTGEVAYVGIMVGAGTRDEREDESGMAHYIEHCVFKGTTTQSARRIINQIEGIGGEINAYTTKEETTFYAAIPVERFAKTLHIIADMVLHPTFPKTQTDKEKQVILDEIESYNDSPDELIYDDFESMLFAGNPLANPILGTRKSVLGFTAEQAQSFINRCYNPKRMVVFSQSRLPMSAVVREVKRCLDDIPYIYTRTREVESHKNDGLNRLRLNDGMMDRKVQLESDRVIHKNVHQSHVMIGGLAYPLGHEQQLTAYLLNNILGGGALNSRLNLSLREKRGLVYTVESTYTPLSDTGYWSIYFACEEKDRAQCTDLVLHELKKLCTEPLSDRQLERAKTQIRGQMAIAAENAENNALTMGKQMLYFGHVQNWEETYKKIANVDKMQLLNCANYFFDTKNVKIFAYVKKK